MIRNGSLIKLGGLQVVSLNPNSAHLQPLAERREERVKAGFAVVKVHGAFAFSSVDALVRFQRGVEWVTTGKVTQEVPTTFPTGRYSERSDGPLWRRTRIVARA